MTGKITLAEKTDEKMKGAQAYFIFQEDIDRSTQIESLDRISGGQLRKRIGIEQFKAEKGQKLYLNLGKGDQILLVGSGHKTDFNTGILKNLSADVFRFYTNAFENNISIQFPREAIKDDFSAGKALGLAFRLSAYRFDRYKSVKKIFQLENCKVYLPPDANAQARSAIEKGMGQGEKIGEAVAYVRDLVNEPASHQSADSLADEARSIAAASGGSITVEILGRKECAEMGMGAYLAVGQGSRREPKFVILKYNNKSKTSPKGESASGRKGKMSKICLIGKSIIFDSGGLSLKPSSAMEDMKIDMSGGATVLGVFKLLAQIETDAEVYGILPACDNMPSDTAMRPGDVVTALNGKTIEILNTDAEGRLTLADALAYAEKKIKPHVIIDLATLTGACMVALGMDIAGLLGNSQEHVDKFLEIARQEGEEAWQLPLYQPYLKNMKSSIADLANVNSHHTGGGTITAGLFLAEFVKNTPWLHLDIAGVSHNKGGDHGVVGKGGTGWGVTTLLEFINNFKTNK